ncbi:hypothetical protein N9427_04225 [Paracoccaceae bacterium]|nr:hypothetical protein [Paracoccaceae bacterium]
MLIPKLSPSGRDREYKQRSFDEISQIVHAWLFQSDLGHRELDRDILDLDPLVSKGWQSMGVLHFLGLKKEFKGIFEGKNINEVLKRLADDPQDFTLIMELLENNSETADENLITALMNLGKEIDENFEENLAHRLNELTDTDRNQKSGQARKEQGILRGILFKRKKEAECALCHRTLPTELMVAAHIKPRSKCSISERKNPNVVMPVCKIGCDDFFEKGYLTVNAKGKITPNTKGVRLSDLYNILKKYDGKFCTHFNDQTKYFFKFHERSFMN